MHMNDAKGSVKSKFFWKIFRLASLAFLDIKQQCWTKPVYSSKS